MEKALNTNGHVIIAAFAMNGPAKCSGLDVERYSPEKLSKEMGSSFQLIKNLEETHITPWQAEQKFMYCCFKKVDFL